MWWGRFSSEGRLDEAQARARWAHVAALADARAAETSRCGFASPTSARCRTTRFKRTSTSASRWGASVPAPSRGMASPTSAATTRTPPYDHPIVLDAPSAAALFDRDPPPTPATLWADAPDAVTPRPVHAARARVESLLSVPLWQKLTSQTRDHLANGWVEKQRMERDPNIDPGLCFYVGQKELGHIHLYAEMHLVLPGTLADAVLAARLAEKFRWSGGAAAAALVDRAITRVA